MMMMVPVIVLVMELRGNADSLQGHKQTSCEAVIKLVQ